jgi:hypothetical protein
LWERLNNENFNTAEIEGFKLRSGENSFTLSPQKWIKSTNAIGIRSKSGRYGGGTFAHKDLAFEFASWLSPEFKLYLITEFQRLKEQEKTSLQSLEWQIKRSLVKTNHKIHTEAIKNQLKKLNLTEFQESLKYADEADMLNLIMFGKKAKDWECQNPDLSIKGLNMRDVADISQLIVLSGLETLNAFLLNQGQSKEKRIEKLINEAKRNLKIVQNQKPLNLEFEQK